MTAIGPSHGAVRSIERLVAVLSLFLLTGVADGALHAIGTAAAPLSLARALLIPFFAMAALLLLREPGAARDAVMAAWPVLLLPAWAALSVLWSTDPTVTAAWLAGLAGTTLVGLFLATRFECDEQLWIVCAAVGAAALISAVLVVAWPQIGTRPVRGMWVGAFEDNNLLGRMAALSTLAFVARALDAGPWRLLATAGAGLSALLVAGSTSVASQVVLGTCVMGMGMVAGRGARPLTRNAMVAAALALVVAAGLLVQQQERVLTWLERDTTMSGRTVLWSHALQMTAPRPLLGHGYATFYPRAVAAPDPLLHHHGVPVRHPHNGFVEVFFELGAVGVALLAVPFLLLLNRALALGGARRADYWPIAYLLFLAVSNLAESGFLRHKIYWALYVALAAQLDGRRPHG